MARTILDKQKKATAVCYVNGTMQQMHTQYVQQHPEDPILATTFRKYTPKRFKTAVKETDLCDYCEKGNSLVISKKFYFKK